MTKQTSIDAYHDLINSGDLTRARRLTLDEIYDQIVVRGFDDVSGGEINNTLSRTVSNPSFHRRADELLRVGVLEYGATRPCRVSGKIVQTYRFAEGFVKGVTLDWSVLKAPVVPVTVAQGVADIKARKFKTESAEKVLQALERTDVQRLLAALLTVPVSATPAATAVPPPPAPAPSASPVREVLSNALSRVFSF